MKRVLVAALVALAAPVAAVENPPATATEKTAAEQPGARDPAVVRKWVTDRLANERYRFCHEADFPLRLSEAAWCPVTGDPNAACPSLPAACKNPPITDDKLPFGARHRLGKVSGEDDFLEMDGWRPPPFAGTLRLLLWILAGAGLVMLVVLVVRAALSWKRNPDEGQDAATAAMGGDDASAAIAAARRAIETDVERLLTRARIAAAEGRFGDAIDDSWAAVLRRLEGEGLIRVHPSRTNGDYVRELRDRPELRARVREVGRHVERVQFGADEPDAARFEAIYQRAVPIATRALILLLVLGVCSPFLGCNTKIRHRGPIDDTPSGASAVRALLEDGGFKVVQRVRPLERLKPLVDGKSTEKSTSAGEAKSPEALVVLPGVVVDAELAKQLLLWARSRHATLIVAGDQPALLEQVGAATLVRESKAADHSGKPATAELSKSFGALSVRTPGARRFMFGAGGAMAKSPGIEGLLQLRSLLADGDESYAVEATLVDPTLGDGAKVKVLDAAQAEAAAHADDVPQADDAPPPEKKAPPHEGPAPAGRVILLADDYLFENAMLAASDDALFLVALMDHAVARGGHIELATAVTGSAPSTPIESVKRGRLAPFLLQLAALLGLFFLYRGVAFGRPRELVGASRRSFADHVRAVGAQYARARAARHAATLYAIWALDRLRERIRPADRRGLTPLAEALAARSRRPVGEVMRILVEAQTLREPTAAAGGSEIPGHDLTTMRELAQLVRATDRILSPSPDITQSGQAPEDRGEPR